MVLDIYISDTFQTTFLTTLEGVFKEKKDLGMYSVVLVDQLPSFEGISTAVSNNNLFFPARYLPDNLKSQLILAGLDMIVGRMMRVPLEGINPEGVEIE